MPPRLRALRRAKALLRSRWGVFALSGMAIGFLLLVGMHIQTRSAPSLAPLLTSSRAASEDLTVWILFQRLDCVSSRWKIEGWSDVAANRMRVVGWALDSPEGWPAGTDPVDRLEVPFEVRRGPAPEVSRALRALGVSVTPAALVVDRTGRLRRVVPGSVLRSPDDIRTILDQLEVIDV